MGTRREDRRTALDILYQVDLTDREASAVMRDWRETGHDVSPFAQELVDGVTEHMPSIDLLLEEQAEGWSVARMTALDRTILRLAVEELLYREDVPPSVAISEAVEAAAELSADESKRFVNGILGRIADGAATA